MKEYYQSMLRLSRIQLIAGWFTFSCGLLSLILLGIRLYLGMEPTTLGLINLIFLPIGLYFVSVARKGIAEYRSELEKLAE